MQPIWRRTPAAPRRRAASGNASINQGLAGIDRRLQRLRRQARAEPASRPAGHFARRYRQPLCGPRRQRHWRAHSPTRPMRTPHHQFRPQARRSRRTYDAVDAKWPAAATFGLEPREGPRRRVRRRGRVMGFHPAALLRRSIPMGFAARPEGVTHARSEIDFSPLGDPGRSMTNEASCPTRRHSAAIPPDADTRHARPQLMQPAMRRHRHAARPMPPARCARLDRRHRRPGGPREHRPYPGAEGAAGRIPRGLFYGGGDPVAPRAQSPATAALALRKQRAVRGDGAAAHRSAYESLFGIFVRPRFLWAPADTLAPLPVAMDPRKDPFQPPEILEGGGSGAGGGSIFRGGGKSPSNLTPRPGEKGLSFRDSLSNPYPKGDRPVFRPGDRAIEMDPSKLPPGSVIRDNVPPGHVTVEPTPWEVLWKAIIET